MPPIIIVMTVLGGISFFLFAVSVLPAEDAVGKRLSDLDRTAVAKEVDDGFFKKLIDEQQRSKLAQKLAAAGWYQTAPTKIVIATVAGVAAGTAAAAALILFVGDPSVTWFCAGALLVFAGGAAPTVLLNRAIERRQKAIHRTLPDFLDMLTTTVEAGISLNAALASSVDAVDGPLADEIKAALSDICLGRARADAMMAMANRVQQSDLTSAVISIVQAERLGGNIARVLEELSSEAREKRMLRAEELAAQLPVKMVFPMALFMLPALITMIFGPVLANLLSGK